MKRFIYYPGPSHRCLLGDYELHCGDCFRLKVGAAWHDVRIELSRDWYLIGLPPGEANMARCYDGFTAEDYSR